MATPEGETQAPSNSNQLADTVRRLESDTLRNTHMNGLACELLEIACDKFATIERQLKHLSDKVIPQIRNWMDDVGISMHDNEDGIHDEIQKLRGKMDALRRKLEKVETAEGEVEKFWREIRDVGLLRLLVAGYLAVCLFCKLMTT